MIAQPSRYAVDLVLDGVRHSYGFAVDDAAVVEEWLYAYPYGRKRVVFERDGEKIEFGSTVRDNRVGLIGDSTRPNALVLSAAARANQPDVMPVYEWFRSGIVTLGPEVPNAALAERLEKGGDAVSPLVDLIRAADLGIADVQVARVADDTVVRLLSRNLDATVAELRARMPDLSRDDAEAMVRDVIDRSRTPSLTFLQGPHATPLTVEEQSEGTRTWLRLVAAGLNALDTGAVLVVDEIDSSLHPRLTARLIELFRDGRTNVHNGQLLFTTHDATLLGTSFGSEILGRDEVWFVEKDGTGATRLYPLSDFHPRKEENAERRYLGGSYGAVPAVFSDTLVERLLQARAEHEHVA